MGATTPDALPWPERNDPADVPQDVKESMTAVQTALNKRMHSTPTVANCTLNSGWYSDGTGFGIPQLHKTGRLVVSRGLFVRGGSNLDVEADTPFTLGQVPVGYIPQASLRVHASWVWGTGPWDIGVGALTIWKSGDIQFIPGFATTIVPGQWISLGGLSWITP